MKNLKEKLNAKAIFVGIIAYIVISSASMALLYNESSFFSHLITPLCAVIGGYTAAKIAKENEIQNSIAVGVILTLLDILLSLYGSGFNILFLIIGIQFVIPIALITKIPTAFFGGIIAKKRKNRDIP